MKFLLSLTSLGFCWTTLGAIALAHNSQLQVNSLAAVEITATYAPDQPMDQAQVTIYRPTEPEQVWQTGQTDKEGKYRFIPDQDGDWEVKVRQAGHGVVAHVPVTLDSTAVTAKIESPDPHEHTPLRQGVMVLSVLWGCVGTALFFSRKS